MKKLGAIIASVAMIGSTLIGGSAVYADQLNQGMYNFVCVDGGRYLNVYAGHDWDGVNVCVWEKDGSPEQNFKLVDRGGNRYVLYPSSSNGRVLDANRGSSYSNPLQAGNNIDIWQTNDTEAQEWYIDDRGGGKYTIELVHARGLVVTCDNPGVNEGNCSLQRYTGASNQLWYLQRTDGGSVKPETPAASSPAPDTSNQSSYKTGIYSIKYQGTNLRSGAGLDHSVVAVVNAGTELNVTSVSGEWGKTNYDGKDCWIRLNGFAEYVRSANSQTNTQAPTQSNATSNNNQSIFADIIRRVGCQTNSYYEEASKMCGAYCTAYARSYLDNNTRYAGDFWCSLGANWRAGGGSSAQYSNDSQVLSAIKSSLDRGRPCVVRVNSSFGGHYLLAIYYNGSGTQSNDIIVVDPWDGTIKTMSNYTIHYSKKQVVTF